MKFEEIRRLIDLVERSDVDEVEVTQWFMNRIRVTRRVPRDIVDRPAASLSNPPDLPSLSSPNDRSRTKPSTTAPPQSEPEPDPEPVKTAAEPAPAPSSDRLHTVTSPIVGTFYAAQSPGAEPFAQVGDRVVPSTVLCIVEAMKIMNEIEAESAGTIEARLVENGEPVEFGQPLFTLRLA
ncbi:MAG: acetyl-CoA carboxylase, biotin carboxyl carrier protein [Gemmatimonadetes bacterium]|nr:acetyl-CoA carboxylase, biotin carboxyl carrier protein [Gemmatimonadota bacterium]